MNAPNRLRLAPSNGARASAVDTDVQHRPLGQVLVERGLLSPEDKLRVLELQAHQDARFGELLVAHGMLKSAELHRALADQFATEVADLASNPPDLALIEAYGVERALETGHLPWRRRDGKIHIATARPDQFEHARAALETLFGPVAMAITSEVELHRALIARHPRSLAAKAEARVPAAESCRERSGQFARAMVILLVVALGATLYAPKLVFYGLLLWTLGILFLQTALKAIAWAMQLCDARRPRVPDAAPLTRLPTVSILVPLYREREIAARLVTRLEAIDYPPELLDICLIVEGDDRVTQDALEAAALPRHMRQIVVPDAALKTKPRALNYALEFCRGSIVGVFDAEDAPAPDQIRTVAARFHAAPPEVVCLQGVLDYYNPHHNWISRCFTIEYATWFRVILPGYLRLGMVIPLGGTTLFFRRQVLEKIGGWDAHNVTEDADLGIRLVRHGYRAELIDSVTEEEANSRLWPWIKQRSRWLKGYAVTWAVHSRNPAALVRDLGAWRAFGVQLLLLGTLTQFAVAPILWSFWALSLGFGHVVHSDLGSTTVWGIAALFVTSEALSIAVRLHGISRTKHRRLKRWVPTLYFYFPLATAAVYKGLCELITRPFYWDKTSHGGFSSDAQAP